MSERTEPHADIDTWLKQTLAEAIRRFPDLCFFLLAIGGQDGELDLNGAANLEREEMAEILTAYVEDPKTEVVRTTVRAN